MKLIVGLGNPGAKYVGTRHNVGFAVLDELSRRHASGPPRRNFQGATVEADLSGERALLLWPHTFMNRSGQSAVAARDFYKLSNTEVLIVCDDLNLPLGKLRLRTQGSSGGALGLEDTIRALGSAEVPRLRVGIGSPPASWDAADYVLAKFSKQELPEIEIAVQRAADAVVTWAALGIQAAMQQFNG